MLDSDELELPRPTEEQAKKYREEGYWSDETFVDHFVPSLENNPEKVIAGPNRTVTYAELADEVEEIATGLQNLGMDKGDVISYQLPNWITTIAINMAIARIGAVANPIIPIYRESEVSYILEDSGSSCIFVPEEYRYFEYLDMVESISDDIESLEHAIVVDGESTGDASSLTVQDYESLRNNDVEELDEPSLSSDDFHVLPYTSGTTGEPKGVLHTHNTVLGEVKNVAERLEVDEDTNVFVPTPVTHVTGLCYGLEMPFITGSSMVMLDIWNPKEAIEVIDEHNCDLTFGATPFLQTMLDAAPDDWESPIDVFGCGGAEVPPNLIYRAEEELDATVFRAYGSTEYLSVTQPTLDSPLEKRAETDGEPAQGVNVKIVDSETREEISGGETGEILAEGPDLMVGYLGEELNEDAFEGKWYCTGDLGYLDEDGWLTVTGRLGDMIIRGGENIPIKEVEDILFEHPAVQEVAVVAMPDEEYQEKACAYVRPKRDEEFTFDDMVNYLDQQNIAKQKYPERLEITDNFPKTASGKIQKYELREDIADKLGMEPVHKE